MNGNEEIDGLLVKSPAEIHYNYLIFFLTLFLETENQRKQESQGGKKKVKRKKKIKGKKEIKEKINKVGRRKLIQKQD